MSKEGRTVIDAIEEHRETLEVLAEHGHTELAEDARALLDIAEERGE
jgi:hypothetical protein